MIFCLHGSVSCYALEAFFEPKNSRLGVLDLPRPTIADLAAYDVCVLPATSDLSQLGGHSPQQLLLARLNPALATDAALVEKAAKFGVATTSSATTKRLATFDTGHPSWPTFVLNEIIAPALARGYDGVLLEGIATRSGEDIALAKAITSAHPNVWVFLQDGFGLSKADGDHLGLYIEGTADELTQHTASLRRATQSGLPALAVGYGKAGDAENNGQLAQSLIAQGAVPFVTLSENRGLALAPLRERSRRVLVLHGWSSKEAEKAPKLPIDTMTADLFQTPLEWLGFEADFFDVGSGELPVQASSRYAAVVLDAELEFPAQSELKAIKWLAEIKAAHIPILFTGGIPFSREDARNQLREVFALRGTLAALPRIANVEVAQVDAEMLQAETKMLPRINDFKDLQAPADARALVTLSGLDTDLGRVRYTPAFIATWGGMWLEPSIILRGSQDSYLFYADPYRMLSAVLKPIGAIPSPDTTTRDGCRLFYSHIDGDGFGSQSAFRGHPFCAELVRDRILKAFPLPVTVSVVEADIRALATGLEDAWGPKFVDIAKSIFALPHIQAASHSFAHPYQWFDGDPDPGLYDEPFMALKPEANYLHVNPEREIRGSVDYINKQLMPPDKRVGLFLWSGNCRPGIEALRLVRELGLENMNGGNTIVSRLYPGIAGVAPRVVPWGDELQINAANQNEFMYANGWSGPFYGGFADVIDTFERTETPRRLKPVNVYYHFYSATSLSSLRALEKIHHWCIQQPLHPVTALQFAQMTRDASRTRLYDLGPRHWLLTNAGHLRTYRLPAELGRPDMSQCKGVTGYTEHEGSLYIHTRGQPRTEIVLSDTPTEPPPRNSAHLYLATSSAEIHFSELEAWKAEFQVESLRPVVAQFSGLPAKAVCDITIDNTLSQQTTDAKGHLQLSLPQNARVTIDANRSRYAVLQ